VHTLKAQDEGIVRLYTCSLPKLLNEVRVMKTNLMHYLSSVYFVTQPLHVSGLFVAQHQEVCCIYTTIGTCCAFWSNVRWRTDSQL